MGPGRISHQMSLVWSLGHLLDGNAVGMVLSAGLFLCVEAFELRSCEEKQNSWVFCTLAKNTKIENTAFPVAHSCLCGGDYVDKLTVIWRGPEDSKMRSIGCPQIPTVYGVLSASDCSLGCGTSLGPRVGWLCWGSPSL